MLDFTARSLGTLPRVVFSLVQQSGLVSQGSTIYTARATF